MPEMSVFWLRAAVALYAAGMVHVLWTVLARQTRFFGAARALFPVAATLHFVSLVERWRVIGHFPVDNFFETTSLCSFLLALAFLLLHRIYRFDSLGVFLFPVVFVMALAGSMGEPVGPWADSRVRDAWLVAHIVLVMFGYAALMMTAVGSIFYLIQEHHLKRKRPGRIFEHLPPLGTLDNMVTRALGAGFVLLTLGTIMGGTWGFIESGTDWIGDARIALALLTWALCLFLIFLRRWGGWRGRKAAVMALFMLGCSAATWVAHVGLRPALLR